MGSKNRAFYIAFCAGLLLASGNANADYWRYAAALNCDPENNRVMIRFPTVFNEDPVSSAKLVTVKHKLAEELSKIPLSEESCQLKNGEKITVSISSSQGFAYGAGGADPDAQFTMKIGDRPVYTHRTFYKGYGKGIYTINAVIYEQYQLNKKYTVARLSECRPGTEFSANQHGEELPKESVCVDASERLSSYADEKTGEEARFHEQEAKKEALEKKLSPVCRRFSEFNKTQPMQGLNYTGSIGRIEQAHGYPPFVFSMEEEDIDNDGNADKIYSIGSETHYFDGNYLVAFLDTAKTAEYEKYMLAHPYDLDDTVREIKFLPQWHAYLININKGTASPRYTSNSIIEFEKKRYIYSRAFNKEVIPSATLNLMTKSHSIKTVCQFP